jgi:hypothetical protein
MSVFIYSLHDPETGHLRYVGKAVNTARRLKNHLSRTVFEKSHRASWIKNLKSRGLKPLQFVVEEVSEQGWENREIFYIARAHELGFDLVNGTAGGVSPVFTPETRRRMRESHLGKIPWNKGKICPSLSFSRKGMKFSEDHKRALSDSAKANPTRMSHIKQLSRTGKKDSEETRQKKSESGRLAWERRGS